LGGSGLVLIAGCNVGVVDEVEVGDSEGEAVELGEGDVDSTVKLTVSLSQ
jgi:hypothetical protein